LDRLFFFFFFDNYDADWKTKGSAVSMALDLLVVLEGMMLGECSVPPSQKFPSVLTLHHSSRQNSRPKLSEQPKISQNHIVLQSGRVIAVA